MCHVHAIVLALKGRTWLIDFLVCAGYILFIGKTEVSPYKLDQIGTLKIPNSQQVLPQWALVGACAGLKEWLMRGDDELMTNDR